MKGLFFAPLLFLATPAFSCFDGINYTWNYQDGLSFVLLGFVAWLVAVCVRAIRGAFGLFIPAVVAVAASIGPASAWFLSSGGDCGFPLAEAAMGSAILVCTYVAYETLRLYLFKRGEAHDA